MIFFLYNKSAIKISSKKVSIWIILLWFHPFFQLLNSTLDLLQIYCLLLLGSLYFHHLLISFYVIIILLLVFLIFHLSLYYRFLLLVWLLCYSFLNVLSFLNWLHLIFLSLYSFRTAWSHFKIFSFDLLSLLFSDIPC